MTKYQKELDAWLLANCFKGQETQYIEKPSKSVFEVVHELFDQSPLFEFFGIRRPFTRRFESWSRKEFVSYN